MNNTEMGYKWIRMVALGIILTREQRRCSHWRSDLPPLMIFSGITFCLASPDWELSGTIPCFIGWYGAGVSHL